MPATTTPIRIGLLLPSTNVTLETELPALLGRHPTACFTIHSSRLRLPVGAEEEDRLPELPLLTRNRAARLVFSGSGSSLYNSAEQAQRAVHRQRKRCVAELVDASCQVLLDGCLETLLAQGLGAHLRILAAIREQVRAYEAAPVILTSVQALLEALKALGAQRIALLLPDPLPVAEQVVAYLTAEQLEVTAWAALDEPDDAAVARVPLERILAAARRLDLTHAQALVLSPEGQMPSLPLIEVAERELGVPVVSTVTAAAFTLLRRLDLPTVLPDAGRLLKHDTWEARSAPTVYLRSGKVIDVCGNDHDHHSKHRGVYQMSTDTQTQSGQTDNRQTAQQIITSLSTSVWAFSTLAAALEAGVLERLAHPHSLPALSQRSGFHPSLIEGMLDLLVALGLLEREGDLYRSTPDLLPLLQTPGRDYLLADIRTTYLQSRQLIDAAKNRTPAVGWHHTDPELLAAQGQGSTGAPAVQQWARMVFPHLDGLMERLQGPAAAFLDVGTGVGALSIEMCRLFPTLQVVGLEPEAAPLAEARRAIARAGLEHRIELRQQRIEDFADLGAFDLIWLPQMFLPREALQCGLRAAWAALRPGGWILLLAVSTPGMTLDAALLRLRNILWGGDPTTPEQVAGLLNTAEFTQVQVFPTAFGSVPRLIAGRRPLLSGERDPKEH